MSQGFNPKTDLDAFCHRADDDYSKKTKAFDWPLAKCLSAEIRGVDHDQRALADITAYRAVPASSRRHFNIISGIR